MGRGQKPAGGGYRCTSHPAAREHQTQKAKTDGVSNCPLCAIGTDANKNRIYQQDEMDADHVTAWSKGGQSTLANCTMLCVIHNRAKGNR